MLYGVITATFILEKKKRQKLIPQKLIPQNLKLFRRLFDNVFIWSPSNKTETNLPYQSNGLVNSQLC